MRAAGPTHDYIVLDDHVDVDDYHDNDRAVDNDIDHVDNIPLDDDHNGASDDHHYDDDHGADHLDLVDVHLNNNDDAAVNIDDTDRVDVHHAGPNKYD